MWYYDDGLDYSNPADREIIEKRKQLEREERIKYIKEQRRSYLKGQRGKRLYYDRDNYYSDNEEAQIKCIFTRDLRREKFLTCLGGHKLLKPLCLCMMLGGLRTGETLGLMWKDIDLKKKTINVDRAITVVPKFDENGKITKRVTVISETKTACSKRTVPMPDLLVDALKQYKINQEIKADEKDIVLTDNSNLVFCNDDGSLRTYYGTKKIFNNFLKKYNLNNLGIQFHTLRHTYSNMLFEADQNPKVIQALLGHKSVKTTITTYNSVDKSYFDKVTNALNEQFKENKNEKIASLVEEDLNELIQMLEEKRMKRKQKDDFEM